AIAARANLAITQSDNSATGKAVPGTSGAYRLVVSNAGPSSVTGARVTDNLPGGISSATWTAAAFGGASAARASGTGSVNTTVNLPPGAFVAFTIIATVDPAATGTLVNTATVTAPAGVTDPNTANNTASDTIAITVPPAPTADLSVTMTDNTSPAGTATPGGTVVYTVVVTNAGPSAVT